MQTRTEALAEFLQSWRDEPSLTLEQAVAVALAIFEPAQLPDVKCIPVAEFRALGFIQEINRRLLHPCGLALSVDIESDGTERLGGIWDYRDDAEGIVYTGPDTIEVSKIQSVNKLMADHATERMRILDGDAIQRPDVDPLQKMFNASSEASGEATED